MDLSTLNKTFKRLTQAAKVKQIRVHDLRHTHASLLAYHGVSAKVISDRLGHTNVGFTLRVYTHLYDEQRKQAAVNLFAGAKNARNRAVDEEQKEIGLDKNEA